MSPYEERFKIACRQYAKELAENVTSFKECLGPEAGQLMDGLQTLIDYLREQGSDK